MTTGSPIDLFQTWLTEAAAHEGPWPNAMCLGTVDAQGRPSTRMVLLRGVDERGFCFYTNRASRKGQDLAVNPKASLCFYWPTLGRQVRVEGSVVFAEESESDAYFASRPRESQISAWASEQSRPLSSRAALEQRVREKRQDFEHLQDVPRPPHWGGYRVVPDAIEFWQEGESRLHSRRLYTRAADGGWTDLMLNP